MKRSFKSMLGVTLLEIMLVLAIAAMIIVMSIRYYQTASLNQKVAGTMDNILGVVGAAESYLTATGTLSAVSDTTLAPYLPNGKMPFTAWGGQMAITSPAPNGYTITTPSVPGGAGGCTQLTALVGQNGKLKMSASCDTVAVSE